MIRKYFMRFGSIQDVFVIRYSAKPFRQEGYAFLRFYSISGYLQLLQFPVHQVNGITFICNPSKASS